MSDVIGVRRAGEARIAFVTANGNLRVGESVVVETMSSTFAATVAIAPDQFPAKIPPLEIAGIAHPTDPSTGDRQPRGSAEDRRYRDRKARFPTLGARVPQGVVVRIDVRHESFDVRDHRGEIVTIPLHTNPDDPA